MVQAHSPEVQPVTTAQSTRFGHERFRQAAGQWAWGKRSCSKKTPEATRAKSPRREMVGSWGRRERFELEGLYLQHVRRLLCVSAMALVLSWLDTGHGAKDGGGIMGGSWCLGIPERGARPSGRTEIAWCQSRIRGCRCHRKDQ